MDAVCVGQFAMVVTFDDVHVILHLIPHGVGLLDAASARGIITCYGQPDHRPTTRPRAWSWMAPVTISEAEAEYSSTNTMILPSRNNPGPWARNSL